MKIKEYLKVAVLIAIIVAVVSITPIVSASDRGQFRKDNHSKIPGRKGGSTIRHPYGYLFC